MERRWVGIREYGLLSGEGMVAGEGGERRRGVALGYTGKLEGWR